MAAMSGLEAVSIGKQGATLGTEATTQYLVPVIPGSFRASENFEQVLDKGRRGRDSMDFRAWQGVGHAEITWEGTVAENDTDGLILGYLIKNLLGKATAQSSAFDTTNYQQLFLLGTLKEYLTVEHKALVATSDRQFLDCRVTEIMLRWNAGEGALTYSVSLVGQSPTLDSRAVPTDNESVDNNGAYMGWQATNLVNGVTNGRLISGEWTLRRTPERFYGSTNVQTFADLYRGPLEVICSLVLDYNANTDLVAFRTKAQTEGGLAVAFVKGTAGAASERRFAIGSVVADLGDGPAELDNSNANIRLGLVARGLDSDLDVDETLVNTEGTANTDQAGPVAVSISQELDMSSSPKY
tara:strand:- start:3878 stop:4939 length:1062 start_codon:yes stop_codon:yes gene_type:complete